MDRVCCRRRPATNKRGGCNGDGCNRRGEAGSAVKRPRGTPPGHRASSPLALASGAALEGTSVPEVCKQLGAGAVPSPLPRAAPGGIQNPSSSSSDSPAEEQLFSGFRQHEIVRLLLQTLSDMGFNASKTTLEQESGICLEPECVAALRCAVLGAHWEDALEAVAHLGTDGSQVSSLRFLILEQKFLEIAAREGSSAALACWSLELSPAEFDADSRDRLKRACEYLACGTLEDLERVSGWSLKGSRQALWERMTMLLPPHLVVPQRRLAVLLWQSVRYQQLHCLYHDANPSGAGSVSLLEDYTCEPPPLPTHCIARLNLHLDEVWFVAASHNGRYIASSSKDKVVILWECNTPANFRVACTLAGHTEPCSHIAWSGNDEYILTASNDHTVRLWAMPCHQPPRVFARHCEAVTGIGWLLDSKRFISAGFDKCIYLWNVEGAELHRWEIPSRVQDIGITSDGVRMIVVDSDRNLKIIDICSHKELLALPESDVVTSVCTSRLREEVLVNIAQQVSTLQQGPVIRLWDLAARRVAQRYFGHFQGRFVIRSCFGGPREEFVFSGSEDAQVYIWHRHYGSLLQVLQGHTSTVNSVCWTHAQDNEVTTSSWLISTADDHTIRIWGASPCVDVWNASPQNEEEQELTLPVAEVGVLDRSCPPLLTPLPEPLEGIQSLSQTSVSENNVGASAVMVVSSNSNNGGGTGSGGQTPASGNDGITTTGDEIEISDDIAADSARVHNGLIRGEEDD